MRCIATLATLCAIVATGAAAEPVRPPSGGGKAQPKRLTALELIAEEEKWIFRAPINRPDVMIDREAELVALVQLQTRASDAKRTDSGRSGHQPAGSDVEQLVAWAKAEEERVRGSVAGRRYEEAIKNADAALKILDAQVAIPDIAAVVVSIRTYRGQAEEAKIRDDAQAAFESLKIRVLGVLWSQDGTRMAIIDGENRALAINDRVKDCPVINIDQDRVDFRFVYGRRRFEFPVYVDQSARRP